MSRLALSERGPESSQEFRVSFIDVMPIPAKDVATEPQHVTDTALTPDWTRRDELTAEGDCVLWALPAERHTAQTAPRKPLGNSTNESAS